MDDANTVVGMVVCNKWIVEDQQRAHPYPRQQIDRHVPTIDRGDEH